MKVYRVEACEDGLGPWQSDRRWEGLDDELRDLMAGSRRYKPIPCFDTPSLPLGDDRRCGCTSVRGLVYWFGARMLRNLLADEYRIAVYVLDDESVNVGRPQCTFKPTDALCCYDYETGEAIDLEAYKMEPA